MQAKKKKFIFLYNIWQSRKANPKTILTSESSIAIAINHTHTHTLKPKKKITKKEVDKL